MTHVWDVPLDKWPPGWLKLQVASLTGSYEYILMHDHEKRKAGLPVTVEEMRRYIIACSRER